MRTYSTEIKRNEWAKSLRQESAELPKNQKAAGAVCGVNKGNVKSESSQSYPLKFKEHKFLSEPTEHKYRE